MSEMSFEKKVVIGFAAMGLLMGLGSGIVGAIVGAFVGGTISTILIWILS